MGSSDEIQPLVVNSLDSSIVERFCRALFFERSSEGKQREFDLIFLTGSRRWKIHSKDSDYDFVVLQGHYNSVLQKYNLIRHADDCSRGGCAYDGICVDDQDIGEEGATVICNCTDGKKYNFIVVTIDQFEAWKFATVAFDLFFNYYTSFRTFAREKSCRVSLFKRLCLSYLDFLRK